MEKTYAENYLRYKDTILNYQQQNKEKVMDYNRNYQTNLRAQKKQKRIKELQEILGISRETIELIYEKGYTLKKLR